MTSFTLDFDQISSIQSMFAIFIGMAIGWAVVMEVTKKMIFDALPNASWWPGAVKPVSSMMVNFGYPKTPTEKFPNAITEPMARDFYAFLTTVCACHALSALPMVPVVLNGWEASSSTVRSMFVLGTLSDAGFDLYDAIKSTIRTFTNHPDPLPIDWWIVIIAMHHTMALSLVVPMNLKYVHREEYHQAAVSLLLAGAVCYGAGCYKFGLNVREKKDFITYKFIMVFQLVVILYTRVWLWFPAAKSLLVHLHEEDDTIFFYGASVLLTIFSVFNLILVSDGVQGVVKWVPKPFPKTASETQKATEDAPGLGVPMPSPAFDFVARIRAKRKLKGAVHSVIASNKLKKMISSASADRKK